MPANFPDNPTVGDNFNLDGRSWTWNGTTWDAVVTAPAVTFTASDTAPGSPVVGSGWFDTTSGQFFIYYDSGWVEFGTNLTGPQGPQGPAGTDGVDGVNGTDGADGADGAPGVVAATSPVLYDSNTQTVSLDDTSITRVNNNMIYSLMGIM